MTALYHLIRGGLLALVLSVAAHDASATATASVRTNIIYIFPTYGYADGVNYGGPTSQMAGIELAIVSQSVTSSFTTSGNATVEFTAPGVMFDADADRFSAKIGGKATANPYGYAFGTYAYSVTLAFTNMSGIDLDGLNVRTGFSAFDYGSNFGGAVDDFTYEFARFSSGQSGPGIGGSHSCDTRLPPGSTNHTFATTPPAVACGVFSPDLSEGEFGIADLDNGETKTRTFTLTYTVEAQSVPEPGTFVLFSAALMGLVGFGAAKRRANALRRLPNWRED